MASLQLRYLVTKPCLDLQHTSPALLCHLQEHQSAVRFWPQPIIKNMQSPHLRCQLRHKWCLEVLATAYHKCRRAMQRPNLPESDWRWPKSHASLVLVAAVLSIRHKAAQTCIPPVLFGAGQNIAFISMRFCLALSKISTKLERCFPCDAPCC